MIRWLLSKLFPYRRTPLGEQVIALSIARAGNPSAMR
jgi:hypothetical protein